MEVDIAISEPSQQKLLAQLRNEQGEVLGAPLDIPVDISSKDLQSICNLLLQQQVIFFIEIKLFSHLDFLLILMILLFAGRSTAVFLFY